MYNIVLYQSHHYLSSLSSFNFENEFFRSSLFRRGKRGQEALKLILFSQFNNNHRIEIKNIFPITVRLELLGEFFLDFSIFEYLLTSALNYQLYAPEEGFSLIEARLVPGKGRLPGRPVDATFLARPLDRSACFDAIVCSLL